MSSRWVRDCALERLFAVARAPDGATDPGVNSTPVERRRPARPGVAGDRAGTALRHAVAGTGVHPLGVAASCVRLREVSGVVAASQTSLFRFRERADRLAVEQQSLRLLSIHAYSNASPNAGCTTCVPRGRSGKTRALAA